MFHRITRALVAFVTLAALASTTAPAAEATVQISPASTIVGITTTDQNAGYWILTKDGRVLNNFEGFWGDTHNVRLNKPIVGMVPTSDALGYWLVAADGGVFAFGDAHFYGSLANRKLASPIVAMAATSDGRGYWLVAADGGVFAFGDAPFFGNATPDPTASVIAISAYLSGYQIFWSDGSTMLLENNKGGASGPIPNLSSPVVGAVAVKGGYWLVTATGNVYAFGLESLPRLTSPDNSAQYVAAAPYNQGAGIIAVTVQGYTAVASR